MCRCVGAIRISGGGCNKDIGRFVCMCVLTEIYILYVNRGVPYARVRVTCVLIYICIGGRVCMSMTVYVCIVRISKNIHKYSIHLLHTSTE